MPKTILVSGSIAYDRIMNFPGRFRDHIMPDKIHVLNLSFEVETIEERFGGTAGNIAYNLKLLNQNPLIISAAGEDFEQYRNHLRTNSIDDSLIKIIADTKTAFVNIITDLDDNQISAFYPGALADASVSNKIPKEVEIAIASPEAKESMMNRVVIYQKKELPYVFDPGQQIPMFSGQELRQCMDGAKILIGNDYEVGLIRQKTGLSIKNILKKVEILVITLGEQGSRIYTGADVMNIKAVKPDKFIDPTGAGDAYRAGFISALIDGQNLKQCGTLASKIAAKAIEYYGAQEHKFEI